MPELVRETEGRRAVDDPEVHRLGARALLGRDRVGRDPGDLGRRAAVDVLAAAEGLDQALVARVVREDAQLDLRIVGREQPAALGRHEGLANAHALGAADRDVLDVRMRRREPARRGAELVEGGMDASGARIHERRQRVDVGVLELGEPAVREDLQRQLVLRRELLEHVLVRRVAGLRLLHHRQLQLLEQDLLELLRRGDQEALARERVDALLELRELAACSPARAARAPPRRCARPRAPCARARA